MTSDQEPAAAPSKPAAKSPSPAKPARDLPSQDDVAAWIEGADRPTLAHLFDQLTLVRFDALTMQIRKEELLPQHWQVISDRALPDDAQLEKLPEVARLRASLDNEATASQRLAALEVAWRELGGKQPMAWTVADLLAAMRRIIEKKLEVDFHHLLSAARDVWTGMTLPHGRTQLDHLWAILAFVAQKTKV